MSRNDFTPDLRAALDRFDAPPLRDGFADQVMAAATSPLPRAVSRDRRGRWKLARRAIIGTVAAGMVSAAAVASGLLGAAGIRVPVLTAMLAPEPVVVAKPKRVARKIDPVKSSSSPKPVTAPLPALSDEEGDAAPVAQRFAEAKARRDARRAERRAFILQNPELVPFIKQAIRNERDFVAMNPEIRELRRLPLAERQAYLAQRPELHAAIRERQSERRAFRDANPEVEAIIRARIEQRRAARQGSQHERASEGNTEQPR